MAVTASIIIAESASLHPDGTVSMLRGGLTNVWGAQEPFQLNGTIVVRIEAEMGDAGEHTFDICCMDEDGAETMPRLSGQFSVPQGGGATWLLIGFNTSFPRMGRYVIVARADNVEVARGIITAATREENPSDHQDEAS